MVQPDLSSPYILHHLAELLTASTKKLFHGCCLKCNLPKNYLARIRTSQNNNNNNNNNNKILDRILNICACSKELVVGTTARVLASQAEAIVDLRRTWPQHRIDIH